MLTGKYYAKRKKVQELFNNSLLQTGDFNVRVTVVDKDKLTSEGAWKETLRDAIGGGIIHSHDRYDISVYTINGFPHNAVLPGYQIIEHFFYLIKDEDMVRINLTNFPTENNNPKSWIIIRV